MEQRNQYLDFLINLSFQGVNRLFVLSLEKILKVVQVTQDILLLVEIKNYNVVIDGREFFDQPVKNTLITYDNIQNSVTGERHDYTTGCFLDYNYFDNYYKIIAIGLSKQQVLDVDPEAIQQISFTVNLDRNGDAIMFFIFEEAKETILDFARRTVEIMYMLSYNLATACSNIPLF